MLLVCRPAQELTSSSSTGDAFGSRAPSVRLKCRAIETWHHPYEHLLISLGAHLSLIPLIEHQQSPELFWKQCTMVKDTQIWSWNRPVFKRRCSDMPLCAPGGWNRSFYKAYIGCYAWRVWHLIRTQQMLVLSLTTQVRNAAERKEGKWKSLGMYLFNVCRTSCSDVPISSLCVLYGDVQKGRFSS